MRTARNGDDDLFDVVGRSILITGASGSLGSVAARRLNAAGANLTLAGMNIDQLNSLTGGFDGPGKTTVVSRRPETTGSASALVEAAVGEYGRLDGVFVASGMNVVAPITTMEVADFERVIDANLRGPWLVCQAVGRQLLAQGDGGSVVLVSSSRGSLGHPAGYSAYGPSKAGVELLTKTLAAEWGPDGIRVNALGPTLFRSGLTAWMYGENDHARETRERFLSRIPLGRLAEPDDMVGPLLFLLSDASAFVTGVVLHVDGGYTAC